MDYCHTPISGSGESVQFALVFLTGLTMSIGHCLGMCGPIVTTYAVAQREPGEARSRLLLPMVRYHLGRVLAYVIVGGLLGALGAAAAVMGAARTVEAALSLLVGMLMLTLGVGLAGLLPTETWLGRLPLARAVPQAIARSIRSRSAGRQFGLGLANGFLPCGPVFAVGISTAASQHPLTGMAAMAVYGLGTVPALIALAFGAAALPAATRKSWHRVGSVLVVLIGLQLLLRGAAGLELIPHAAVGQVVFW